MSTEQFCAIVNCYSSSFLAIFAIVAIASVQSAFPPSLRYPLPVAANKIIEAEVNCDSGFINASVTLQYPFKGILFAKDFSQECKTLGDMSNSLRITFPTSGCGVRLSTRPSKDGTSTEMFYGVVLVVQQDRHLRQIADQEKYLECPVNEDTFTVQSQPMAAEVVRKGRNFRTGRMKNHETEEATRPQVARAWMEITPEDDQARPNGGLQVGDSALLIIKSTLPAGIGWKVIECVAHDGLGDSSQKLLDEDGCPIDELLLPIPELGPIHPILLMRHQEAVAKFAAFKFPDRDRLHLSCGLELCRGTCPEVDCRSSNRTHENRLGRNLPVQNDNREDGEILDRLKVYNSVEVLAPAIDDLRKSERLQQSDPSSAVYPFANLPGDRTFCVSPDKLALTFCILGVIFLCAVIVAACALLKARRSGSDGPFYTRSMFSSGSSSGGSAYGSKLLLHDSPCMGQPARTSGMHYGRIL